MDDLTFRLVEANEEALIFSFLTIAAQMENSGEAIQKVPADPDLRKYWKDWGREGDLGVAAESAAAGRPVACAWVRLFSGDAPGFGFVAEEIPELGIATVASARNKRIGSKTFAELLERRRGCFPGVSLSVQRDSPAVRLYRRFGFEPVRDSEKTSRGGTSSVTMLLRFQAPVLGMR